MSKLQELWSADGPDGGPPRLLATRCGADGQVFFPRVDRCPGSLDGSDVQDVTLSGEGTLYAWSVLHVGAKGFDAPYAVAYVDMPEGVRIFGHLDDWNSPALAAGARVRVYPGVIGRDREGQALTGVRLRVAA